MADGSPDLVDCARLAKEACVVERVYPLDELPRFKGLMAAPGGVMSARFAFTTLPSGQPGVDVTVDAVPQLECQRCLQPFAWQVSAGSQVEFTTSEGRGSVDAERECVVMQNGRASLVELAEEELLLAVPIAPKCSAPLRCGKAPRSLDDVEPAGVGFDERRPFGVLNDLLRKT